MLSVRNLSKTFSGPRSKTVLGGVSLDIAPGEYVAVMGESGVGKSTLLNLIAGLDRPDSGSVSLWGNELTRLGDDALTLLRRRDMGFVFQAFHVLSYLSVAQNVALPLALNGVPDAQIDARVARVLAEVGLAEHATSMPRELSGGETQRVAIARALVHRPKLVLADEPTGNLDPETAAQVLGVLRACVKEEGAAGILITHSRAAAATADRVVLLSANGLLPAQWAAPAPQAG